MTKNLRDVRKLPKQYRTFEGTITRAASDDDPEGNGASVGEGALYDISISSETEVRRWFGIEVLDHGGDAVNMERLQRGAAVLVDHGGDQVGVVEAASVKGKRLVGKVRFSRSQRGREVEQDVADGIRRNISVGYTVDDAVLAEKRDGVDVWRVTRWTPAEVSIVSVPADVTVGVGRSDDGGELFPVTIKDGDAVERGEPMLRNVLLNQAGAGGGAAPPPAAATGEDRAKRLEEIAGICAANGLGASDVESYQRGEWTSRTVADIAMDVARKRAASRPAPPSAEALGLSDIPAAELERYSYHRAIRQTLLALENPHNSKFDGLEAEVHQHLERNWPADMKRNGGFLAPLRTRTLASTVAGKGPEVVPMQAGELIELLRAKAAILRSGARLLTGLTGPVGFPRVTGGVTVAWVPENPVNDTPSSDPSLGIAMLSPKTLQGVVPFTRQLAVQSSFDVESWVRDELATGHSLAFDKGAMHGKGSGGEVTGIYYAQNVGSKNFSSTLPDLPALMDMVVNVADNNADFGAMRWVMSVLMAGRLRSTQEFASTNGVTLWQGNLREGTVLGYGATSTTQASKALNTSGVETVGQVMQAAVFGNWSDLLVGMFGAMEFVVDPFTKKAKNIVEVSTFQMGDILPRHGQSFCKALALPAA